MDLDLYYLNSDQSVLVELDHSALGHVSFQGRQKVLRDCAIAAAVSTLQFVRLCSVHTFKHTLIHK